MKDFHSTLSVEALGGKFAVVRVEQWRTDDVKAAVVRNKIMADGPFDTREDADRKLRQIDARAG